jgi:hypothetical protein
MFSRKKRHTRDARLDRLGQEVLHAFRVSEAEVEAAADSPDLYAHLRARIAAEQRQQAARKVSGWRASTQPARAVIAALRWPRWALAAGVAALVWLALTAPGWLRTPAPEPKQSVTHTPPAPTPNPGHSERAAVTPAPAEAEKERASAPAQSANPRRRAMRSPSLSQEADEWMDESEIATDYLPLTYLTEATALDGGQVVRIQVPRSMLVSLGLPVNVERAGELVLADVVLGDDGVARAIRFVQ